MYHKWVQSPEGAKWGWNFIQQRKQIEIGGTLSRLQKAQHINNGNENLITVTLGHCFCSILAAKPQKKKNHVLFLDMAYCLAVLISCLTNSKRMGVASSSSIPPC